MFYIYFQEFLECLNPIPEFLVKNTGSEKSFRLQSSFLILLAKIVTIFWGDSGNRYWGGCVPLVTLKMNFWHTRTLINRIKTSMYVYIAKKLRWSFCWDSSTQLIQDFSLNPRWGHTDIFWWPILIELIQSTSLLFHGRDEVGYGPIRIGRYHTEDLGFPGKVSAWNAGDPGSIPGLGRSPGEENGNSLLPRKFHGWRSLVGYSPWGCQESDTTKHPCFCFRFIQKIWKRHMLTWLLFCFLCSTCEFFTLLENIVNYAHKWLNIARRTV